MSIDKLISLSNFGFDERWWAGAFDWWTIGGVIFVMIFAFFLLEGVWPSILGGIAALLIFGVMVGGDVLHEEFKEEHLTPYVSQLKYKELPIDDISFLEGELPNETYFSEKEMKGEETYSVLITYSEKGKIKVLKTNALIRTDVENIEDIHMEYKSISKDIPDYISKGDINHIVHVPEDFFKKKLLMKETSTE